MANKQKAYNFKITFPYGSKDGYYYAVKGTRNSSPPYGDGKVAVRNGTAGAYHLGDDRAMPIGTDVTVNGHKIGDSGKTGTVSGPHLHISRFLAGKVTNPKGKGFVMKRGPLGRALVTDKGFNNVAGFWINVRSGYGAVYQFNHLNSLPSIKKGTRL